MRGNAGVTCLCKEAQGSLSLWCCKHNEMDFPCNQSVKISIAVELFYERSIIRITLLEQRTTSLLENSYW